MLIGSQLSCYFVKGLTLLLDLRQNLAHRGLKPIKTLWIFGLSLISLNSFKAIAQDCKPQQVETLASIAL